MAYGSLQANRQTHGAEWDRGIVNRLLHVPVLCGHAVGDGYLCRHSHVGLEFLYVRTGEGVFIANGTVLPFKAPMLIHFDGKMPHGVQVLGPYDRWNAAFLPEAFSSHPRLGGLSDNVSVVGAIGLSGVAMVPVADPYRQRLERVFADINAELTGNGAYRYEIIMLRLMELGYLFRRLQETWHASGQAAEHVEGQAGRQSATVPVTHALAAPRPEFMSAAWATQPDRDLAACVLSYIEAHLGEPVTAKQLGRHFHCSPSQVYRVVRHSTGHSLGRYLKHRRIERAKQLLTITDLPVKEVAAAVGIPEASQFWRAFRELVGEPPQRFRDRMRLGG